MQARSRKFSEIPIVIRNHALHPDEASVECYLLGLAGIAVDIILSRQPVIESGDESGADAGAFLVDGVVGRVEHPVNALSDGGSVIPLGDGHIDGFELGHELWQILEHYSLRMAQEQQIHRFRQRLHLDFQSVVVREQDAEVFCHHEPAQLRFLEEDRLYDCLLQAICPKLLDSILDFFGEPLDFGAELVIGEVLRAFFFFRKAEA